LMGGPRRRVASPIGGIEVRVSGKVGVRTLFQRV
jgi:hypothetical protein